MTHAEINKHILHYLTDDKTKSAIMLTAPWGTGKSYYIQNELKPFLEKKENGSHKCIVVSLYNVHETSELSQQLFYEKVIPAPFLNPVTAKISVIAKTIIKSLPLPINFNLSEKDQKKLYESIDFSGCLIILEDLERSGMSILDVLGFVNNLVEQDGVKVLLVANEDEIMKYQYEGRLIGKSEKDEIDNYNQVCIQMNLKDNNKSYTSCQDTETYLKIKEKTISYTIQFEVDNKSVIDSIIRSFENKTLNLLVNEKDISDIASAMKSCKRNNFRSFTFSCQKAVDLYETLEKTYTSDRDFVKTIFLGILCFVLKQKAGEQLKWNFEKHYSFDLGNEHAPLFHFCYTYLTEQRKDLKDIESTYQAFRKYVLYQKNYDADPDVSILKNYYIETEENVRNALDNITKKLRYDNSAISFYQYGTIALYAIKVKDLLEYDIDDIKKLLINNLKGRGDNLEFEQIFFDDIDKDAPQPQKDEYRELREKIAQSLNTKNFSIPNFAYLPSQSNAFYKTVLVNENYFRDQHSFLNSFDIVKLAEMFEKSTAKQKQDIRSVFLDIYNTRNIGDYFASDRNDIEALLERIKDSKKNAGDRIQQQQYEWFIEILTKIKEKLS